MANVIAAHPFQDQKTTYFNLLDNFKIGIDLVTIYLLTFLVILTIAFFINGITSRIRLGWRRTEMRRVRMRKGIASALSSFGESRLSAMGLFALFVQMFLWFSELFLTNNIKV